MICLPLFLLYLSDFYCSLLLLSSSLIYLPNCSKTSRTVLMNNSVENALFLVPGLSRMLQTLCLNYDTGCDLSFTAFSRLKNVCSVFCLLKLCIRKGCCNLVNAIPVFLVMVIRFLCINLLAWHTTFIDLGIFNHSYTFSLCSHIGSWGELIIKTVFIFSMIYSSHAKSREPYILLRFSFWKYFFKSYFNTCLETASNTT